MKNFKRFLAVMMCVAIAVLCLFAMSSCGDDHTHSYTDTVVSPTCAEQGYTTHTCSCGHSYNDSYVSALGHEYTSTVVEPTCSARGYTQYTCSKCDHTYSDSYVDALEHDYKSKVTAPTCTENGYTTYTCKDCGYSYKGDETPAAHDYMKVETKPTCTEDGRITYVCKNCDDSYDGGAIPAAHDYKKVVTKPTCDKGGYTTYTCKNCEDSYVDDYTSAAHDYRETIIVEPTCTEDGTVKYECKSCAHSYTDTVKGGHELISYEGKEATCVPGYEAYEKCVNCDYTTYKEIPANGEHEYETKVSRFPTTILPGIEKTYCVVCGDVKGTTTIEVVTVSLPSVTEAIVKLLGDCHYELEIGEGSTIIYSRELDDYTYEDGQKVIFNIRVAKAVIDVTDSHLTGSVDIEFGATRYIINGTSEDDAFDALFTMSVSIDGDALTVSAKMNEDAYDYDANISNLFYQMVASKFGLSYEQALEFIYVGGQLRSYLPLLENVAAALSELEYVGSTIDLSFILPAISDKVMSITYEDGNYRYELDIEALSDFVEELQDKNIAELVDSIYGEGTMDAISEYVKALPKMTVMQIANAAILIAENYEIDVDMVYQLVNYVVYAGFGVEFDVEAYIASYYDYTLADIVAEILAMKGMDASVDEISAKLTSSIASFIDLISESTVDELYERFVSKDAPFTLTESLNNLVAMLDYMADFSMLVDSSSGEILDFNATLIMAGGMEAVFEYEVTDGGFDLVISAMGYSVYVSDDESSFDFIIASSDNVIAEGSAAIDGDAFTLSATAMGYTISASGDSSAMVFGISMGDKEIVKGNATTDGDAFTLSAEAMGYEISMNGNSENATFTISRNKKNISSGTVAKVEGGIKIEGKIFFDIYTSVITLEFTDNGFAYKIAADDTVVEEFKISFKDGKVSELYIDSNVVSVLDMGVDKEYVVDDVLFVDYVNTEDEFGFKLDLNNAIEVDIAKISEEIKAEIAFGMYAVSYTATMKDGNADVIYAKVAMREHGDYLERPEEEFVDVVFASVEYSATTGEIEIIGKSPVFGMTVSGVINSSELTLNMAITTEYDAEAYINAGVSISKEALSASLNYFEGDWCEKVDASLVIDENGLVFDFDLQEYNREKDAHYLDTTVDVAINADGATASAKEYRQDGTLYAEWIKLNAEFAEGSVVGTMDITTQHYDYSDNTSYLGGAVVAFSYVDNKFDMTVTLDGKEVVAELKGEFDGELFTVAGVIDDTDVEYVIGMSEGNFVYNMRYELREGENKGEYMEFAFEIGKHLIAYSQEMSFYNWDYHYDETVDMVVSEKVLESYWMSYYFGLDGITVAKRYSDGEHESNEEFSVEISEDGIELYIYTMFDYEYESEISELEATLNADGFELVAKYNEEEIAEINASYADGIHSITFWVDYAGTKFDIRLNQENIEDGIKSIITYDIDELVVETGYDYDEKEYMYKWYTDKIAGEGSISFTIA